MNKKEVLEIRKQFSPENCTITRICGCYVDAEKNIKTELKEAFLSLPEEDTFKYFTIFKQTLSGSIGKKLLNIDFPLDEEKEEGKQSFLLRLRNSKLKDDQMVSEFYNRIIESYDFGENYYIILIHAVYDVPGKATDGTQMYDASDNVFEYIMCSICPVHLSKEGLGYNSEKNTIENRIRDWIVDAPDKGFMFPVFNDRFTDIHSILYYSKNAEELQEAFIEDMFGCRTIPLSAENQKETFNAVIATTLGDDCDYNIVKNIHETLGDMLEESKDFPEPLTLTKTDVKRLFEDSGVPDDKMEEFDHNYEMVAGEKTALMAANITNPKKFNIETPDVVIKVNPEYTSLIETKYIDGRQCLVIPVSDHMEVNGISVTAFNHENEVAAGTAADSDDM